MANITPTPPSFAFSYWRPWKEESNKLDSFLDYTRDVSLAKYQADTVGQYISQASTEQIQAIGDLGQKVGLDIRRASERQVEAIGDLSQQISADISKASVQNVQAIEQLGNQMETGLNILSDQMSDITTELTFVNKNLTIQIEQQKLTNLLLENVCDLLRVPDSEKERQHCIELGLKFFVNAQKDDDLFADALEELLDAEKLMKQDYFVLHRIGLIYMYSIKHINPLTAIDYFTRAAKYASVESDPKAARLANVLARTGIHANTNIETDTNSIQSLAADSYEKAAFAAYVLGNFELSVMHQNKAVKYNNSAENYYFLAKYQTRTKQIDLSIQNLEMAINKMPASALAVFKDLDLVNEPEVLKLIGEKNNIINQNIHQLIRDWETVHSNSAKSTAIELNELLKATYDNKVEKYLFFNNLKTNIEDELRKLRINVPKLKKKFQNTMTIFNDEIETIVASLDNCIDKPFEIIKEVYENCSIKFIPLKIGLKYAGGIVFYIDESGKYGLVSAMVDQSNGINWDCRDGYLNTFTGSVGTAIGEGKSNTKKIVDCLGEGNYAAKVCADLVLEGFSDWFLPSKDELSLMYNNLRKKNLGDFRDSRYYWSSSEDDKNKYNAWTMRFSVGSSIDGFQSEPKSYEGNTEKIYDVLNVSVRAIREF